MDDYKEYEKQRNENIKRNEKFLEEFENWLEKDNLSAKTINKHISNVDLYINDFLNYYEIYKMVMICLIGVLFNRDFFRLWIK